MIHCFSRKEITYQLLLKIANSSVLQFRHEQMWNKIKTSSTQTNPSHCDFNAAFSASMPALKERERVRIKGQPSVSGLKKQLYIVTHQLLVHRRKRNRLQQLATFAWFASRLQRHLWKKQAQLNDNKKQQRLLRKSNTGGAWSALLLMPSVAAAKSLTSCAYIHIRWIFNMQQLSSIITTNIGSLKSLHLITQISNLFEGISNLPL